MVKRRAFLLDVEFVMRQKRPAIRLSLVDEAGRAFRAFDEDYEPYFYLLPDAKLDGRERELFKQRLTAVKAPSRNELARVKRVDEEEKQWRGARVTLFKIVAFNPGHVPALRDALKPLGETFEHNIPFTKRYLIDKQLVPSALVELDVDDARRVRAIRSLDDPAAPPLRLLAFDLETHNPRGVSEPQRDPILMVGYAGDAPPSQKKAPATAPAPSPAPAAPARVSGVLSHSKKFSEPFVQSLATEKAMLEAFARVVKDSRAHVLCTYNGDVFDVPFLAERAKRTKAAFSLSRDGSPIKTRQAGARKVSSVAGRVHFDVFNSIAFLNYIGAIRVPRLTLERVYAEVLGKQKPMVEKKEIFSTWDAGKTRELDALARYCQGDANACLDLAHYALPLELGLSRVVGDTLFNVSRATSSQLVEHVLMRRAFARGELIPNKPGSDGDAERDQGPIQGAFVKTPAPGVYENIAVIDFKSLYPSIIVSHNIDPGALDCTDCGPAEAFVSPQGHRFCAKRKGLLPEMLEDVMKTRWAVQAEMKKHAKGSDAYNRLHAQQWALKILMNSTYGYLLFNRARWYSREGGEATTAWGRQYFHETAEKAEKAGFKVLYGDSVTRERFVTLLDAQGVVRVKNVEALFDAFAGQARNQGEKEVVDLDGEYQALTVDPETGDPCWRPLLAVIRHRAKKRIFRVWQKHGETRVTEDHSLLTRRSDRLEEITPERLASENAPMARVHALPSVQTVSEIDVYAALRDYRRVVRYKGRDKTLRAHADAEWVWFGWTRRKNAIRIKRFLRVGTPEFDSFCRLLGAYVAEGSASTPETTSSKTGASITSSSRHWLERLHSDYRALFDRAKPGIIPSQRKLRHLAYVSTDGTKKTTTYADETLKLQMSNALAAHVFRAFCGQKSQHKRLPWFAFHVPRREQLLLLRQMIIGDGSQTQGPPYSQEYVYDNFKYTTNSLELASGLSVLLTQLGQKHTLQYRPSKNAYSLQTCSDYNTRLQTRIRQEPYEGFVYDLSVDGSHSFVDACGQVLLHNTDGIFLQYTGKSKDDVKKFVQGINASLPKQMQVELEAFYPRGIFVSKKQEAEKGAKKKYALIDEDGRIKIRGFELVRRDWSRVARETQRRVLEALLKDGDVEKAKRVVTQTIEDLRAGRVPLADCVIFTQLRKNVKAYDIKSPEVHAVIRARKAGLDIPELSVVGYVITTDGKTISEKAQVAELAKEYDPDYYINNQVLPSVLKILAELGVNADDLKTNTKQKGLGEW